MKVEIQVDPDDFVLQILKSDYFMIKEEIQSLKDYPDKADFEDEDLVNSKKIAKAMKYLINNYYGTCGEKVK